MLHVTRLTLNLIDKFRERERERERERARERERERVAGVRL